MVNNRTSPVVVRTIHSWTVLAAWFRMILLLFFVGGMVQEASLLVVVWGFSISSSPTTAIHKRKRPHCHHHNNDYHMRRPMVLVGKNPWWFDRQVSCLLFSATDDATNQSIQDDDDDDTHKDDDDDETVVVDVAIVGAGLGGLCAGAILNTLYGKRVGIYDSHYLAGGCAHAFDRTMRDGRTVCLDSGPTILLGCSTQQNPLQQVLNAVGQEVSWIPYYAWGMIEPPPPSTTTSQSSSQPQPPQLEALRWKMELGPTQFQQGPLRRFGGPQAELEYQQLRQLTRPLVAGAAIPALAMRSGPTAVIPLLVRHFGTLVELIQLGAESTTGTFAPYMDGPLFTVTDPWLRNWLDALAFSLSGLPASRTAAAAMAFTLMDLHQPQNDDNDDDGGGGACLDYPVGGLGSIVNALVRGVEQGSQGSKVHLRRPVQQIDFSESGDRATGLTLANGQRIVAKEGVICNAPVWSFRGLVQHHGPALQRLAQNTDLSSKALAENDNKTSRRRRSSWIQVPPSSDENNNAKKEGDPFATLRWKRPSEWDDDSHEESVQKNLLDQCDLAEQTGSFLHLHLALNATGLDLTQLEAHYTVMDRGLSGTASWDGTHNNNDDNRNNAVDGPCGELNMIALSNPCVLDPTLAPEGTIVVHAYGAGNEPYELWEGLDRKSQQYQDLKQERAQVLWRAVESIIPTARDRVLLELIGSPLTHERFLRRPQGTYGSATEDYLKDGATPIANLVLAGDGVFPGIGLPAVAISGASAANSLVNPWQHLQCLQRLDQQQQQVEQHRKTKQEQQARNSR